MNIYKIVIALFLLPFAVSSCYEDLGNYDYRKINEISVSNIEPEYAKDVDDRLTIEPKLDCSLYSDTTKFIFEWYVENEVIATTKNIDVTVNVSTGRKNCKYIITDKETKVKTITNFILNVSSSTAGDLYMILSKSKGKAELSYLRLDKPSNFVINYFEGRNGYALGENPNKLAFYDSPYKSSVQYPFAMNDGRMYVQVDNKTLLFDKSSLEPDEVTPALSGENYVGYVTEKPDVAGYSSEYIQSKITTWRMLNNGAVQIGALVDEVSGGRIYRFRNDAYMEPTKQFKITSFNNKDKCYYSSFCYYDFIVDAKPSSKLKYNIGNDFGNLMVFDKSVGRFGFITKDVQTASEISEDNVPFYPGYDLIYGSNTSDSYLSFAVITNGSTTKMIFLNRTNASPKNPYVLLKEVIVTDYINKSTKFHVMKYAPYILFATGDKLYSYNILDAVSGIPPTRNNEIAKLSDFGYDNNAEIKDICMSRSQRTLLLGISRYGSDSEAMGDENKGDLLELNFNKELFQVTLRKLHKGVCGNPVDVEIKYQHYYRNGEHYEDGRFTETF